MWITACQPNSLELAPNNTEAGFWVVIALNIESLPVQQDCFELLWDYGKADSKPQLPLWKKRPFYPCLNYLPRLRRSARIYLFVYFWCHRYQLFVINLSHAVCPSVPGVIDGTQPQQTHHRRCDTMNVSWHPQIGTVHLWTINNIYIVSWFVGSWCLSNRWELVLGWTERVGPFNWSKPSKVVNSFNPTVGVEGKKVYIPSFCTERYGEYWT